MAKTQPAGKSAPRRYFATLRSPTWTYPLLFLAFYIAIFAYYDFRLVLGRKAALIGLDFPSVRIGNSNSLSKSPDAANIAGQNWPLEMSRIDSGIVRNYVPLCYRA